MKLTKEFFEDIHNIRVNNDKVEESLSRLAASKYFSNIAVFYGESWSTLRQIVENRQDGLCIGTKAAWIELAMPEIFLAIREMPEEIWAWGVLAALGETNSYKNDLYCHLINAIRAGIERHLLDGVTLSKEIGRNEDEWPELLDNDETYIPGALISQDNTEEQAMDNMLLQEIRDYLDDEEWTILTADYGADDELAEALGINIAALHTRRSRVRKRVKILFE